MLCGPVKHDDELIHVRAKACGPSLGLPLKLTPYQRKEARACKANGELVPAIARTCNVRATTISRLAP